ncbi:MAG TPA: DUF1801 domain-containing protein [Gemmataceae bacterium]|nr:DUF1801 domain-containing protein [Gemmataceae bacterium]
MAKSNAATVQEYLDELPEERRTVVAAVRDVVLRNLPTGYREAITYGLISYEIPLERYPNTYNGQPLMYAALAAQKNHFALYLMTAYGDGDLAAWLKEQFKKAGKKLDMGKSCLRFRKLEDLPLDVIGKFVAKVPPEKYIAWCEAVRRK